MNQQLFFTADLHFGHAGILKHTARGTLFDSINQHDLHVVDSINKVVGAKDILYILGDVSWYGQWVTGALIDGIRCQNRYLVYGNHDNKLRDFYKTSGLFKECSDRMFFKHYSNKLCLDHFPSAEWAEAHHGSWMLHGHTHGSFDYEARGLANYRIFDVGWDESQARHGLWLPSRCSWVQTLQPRLPEQADRQQGETPTSWLHAPGRLRKRIPIGSTYDCVTSKKPSGGHTTCPPSHTDMQWNSPSFTWVGATATVWPLSRNWRFEIVEEST
jgi:calcineurin-like phosphoesterase family protein